MMPRSFLPWSFFWITILGLGPVYAQSPSSPLLERGFIGDFPLPSAAPALLQQFMLQQQAPRIIDTPAKPQPKAMKKQANAQAAALAIKPIQLTNFSDRPIAFFFTTSNGRTCQPSRLEPAASGAFAPCAPTLQWMADGRVLSSPVAPGQTYHFVLRSGVLALEDVPAN